MKDPKKAMYNKVYNKTTVSVDDLAKAATNSPKQVSPEINESNSRGSSIKTGCLPVFLIIAFIAVGCSILTGKNDKSVSKVQNSVLNSMNIEFYDNFEGDDSGNWKRAQVSTSVPVQDYALGYYNKYFKSDDEIHVIYNPELNTSNRLLIENGTLTINTAEYINGEEQSVKTACTGRHLASYCLDLETGELLYSNIAEEPTEVRQLTGDEVAKIFEPTEASTETTSQTDYDDTSVQQSSTAAASQDTPFEHTPVTAADETTYIINTDSGKFHAINGPDTDTIAPENRLETSKSKEELISDGYEPCGRCF